MCDYFRGANVVKSHKLNRIIANHCLTIDCISKLEPSESDVCVFRSRSVWQRLGGEWMST